MLRAIASKLFGTNQSRLLSRYKVKVLEINALESEIAELNDEGLQQRARTIRQRASEGETTDALLPETFALVREAASRSLGQRHYDVQLIGGMVLAEGAIAEMKTGEGKTLVATLAASLNALVGNPVHIVTVNDYLAQRDAQWMAAVYQQLGLSVGCIHHGLDDEQRRQQYACDVTYGTNNELGFDYLRDNMKVDIEQMVQRGHGFAVVDEVDSILIDEARTPLIISGAVADQSDLYVSIDNIIPSLEDKDYELDEKHKAVHFTDEGSERIEKLLQEAGILPKDGGLFDAHNVSVLHHCNSALRAHKLFVRDKDYIVKDAKVVIIDEFTGRMMPGRRYSDGLHQALEAKEKAEIQPENQTLASITFQNYFRMYDKLSGMTGTALTEAEEFDEIYKLKVIEVPTNVPVRRLDEHDEVYRTAEEKYDAVVELIQECHDGGQPVLVGTTSIDKSEILSRRLNDRKLPHHVLNARYHEQEAQIIAQAGMPGAITIATNMAGRGTDIQLGGNADMRIYQECYDMPDGSAKQSKIKEIHAEILQARESVLQSGGLYVLATERHESRRIDNQLRGRSGRQGDPGVSKFFLSLEDDLMRIFGSDRLDSMLGKLGLSKGEAIIHPWVTKALETAQKKVEAHHFATRKNVLKYDDVMGYQRSVIFDQRIEYMHSDDLSETIKEMRQSAIADAVEHSIPKEAYPHQWNTSELADELTEMFGLRLPIDAWAAEEGIDSEGILSRVNQAIDMFMAQKERAVGGEVFRRIEKMALLQSLDTLWREHLQFMEHLRQVIGLRGYGQRDPLNEYKTESFSEFELLLNNLRNRAVTMLAHTRFTHNADDSATDADSEGRDASPAPVRPTVSVMPMGQYRREVQDSQQEPSN